MSHNEVYLSLEINENSIVAVVGEFFQNEILVLANYEKNFKPENIMEALEDVKNNITSLLGYQIRNTILVMPSNHIKKYADTIRVDTRNSDQVVTKDEIALGVEQLIKKNDTHDNFVANVSIDRYSAYGYGYVSNPVGLETRYIELEASVYTLPTKIAYPLIKLVEEAGFNVVDVCLDVIALAQEVCTPIAFKNGSIIVDLAQTSTNLAYFANNTLKSFSTVAIGSKTITNDIALCTNLDFEKAQSFKDKYVDLDLNNLEDLTIYKYFDEINNEEVEISQKLVSEIALDRIKELFTLLNREIDKFELNEDTLVYFCGEGINFKNFEHILKKYFKHPYQLGKSRIIGARNAKFSKCLGAIRHIAIFSRKKGEIKLFVNKKEYNDAINLVEKNNLLYNGNNSEKDFIERLVSYIFNN